MHCNGNFSPMCHSNCSAATFLNSHNNTVADGEGIISQNLSFVSMSSKAQECLDFVNFMCV